MLFVFFHQLAKSERHGPLDHAFHGKLPIRNVFIPDLRYMAMVADVEEFRTREETLVVEVGEGCLDVERVDSGQTNQPGVSGQPAIRGLFVLF